jgi:hypothetical protein
MCVVCVISRGLMRSIMWFRGIWVVRTKLRIFVRFTLFRVTLRNRRRKGTPERNNFGNVEKGHREDTLVKFERLPIL